MRGTTRRASMRTGRSPRRTNDKPQHLLVGGNKDADLPSGTSPKAIRRSPKMGPRTDIPLRASWTTFVTSRSTSQRPVLCEHRTSTEMSAGNGTRLEVRGGS
jgi:hypothetical protein